MTNIEKVRNYYNHFDEWNRLDTPEGQLELKIVIDLICKHIQPESTILDLGGGPGRYTVELSNLDYNMHLGDLSPELINIARLKSEMMGNQERIKEIGVINALDLSNYESNYFDAILLFGPLYHLTSEDEISQCLKEVYRVLKPNGTLCAIFIPWITGLTGIIERSFYAPKHVSPEALMNTFDKGIFNNQSEYGFQEGSFLKVDNMVKYFKESGFSQVLLRSIRSLGYRQEKNILALEKDNPEYFKTILKVIDETSEEKEVIETCGHAIYIGKKSIKLS